MPRRSDPVERLQAALQRVRDADARAGEARRQLRLEMRKELDARNVTQAQIAEAFGVSRQRVRQMLNELDR